MQLFLWIGSFKESKLKSDNNSDPANNFKCVTDSLFAHYYYTFCLAQKSGAAKPSTEFKKYEKSGSGLHSSLVSFILTAKTTSCGRGQR